MNGLFVAFWSFLIFISLAWYGVLVFYIGVKGGAEIGTMITRLQKNEKEKPADRDRKLGGPDL